MQGKKAIVTGAGAVNGIGYAIAQQLASRGVELVVAGLSDRIFERATELQSKGLKALAWQGDLTDSYQAEQLVQFATSKFGCLDILVNNAGMTSISDNASSGGEAATAADLSADGWKRAIARNLDSAFFVTKFALPYLRQSGAGRIVMISSVTGPLMAMRNEAGYAAAKAGLVGLARSIALDEAQHRITVNVVAPGWIATDSQSVHEGLAGDATPIGRSGTPAEVAAVVEFLCQTNASYVTGQMIVVDGGNSIAEERN